MLERLALVSLLAAPAAPAASGAGFDHAPWDSLLRRHVVDGMVDYDAFKTAPAGRDPLRLDAQQPGAGAPAGRPRANALDSDGSLQRRMTQEARP